MTALAKPQLADARCVCGAPAMFDSPRCMMCALDDDGFFDLGIDALADPALAFGGNGNIEQPLVCVVCGKPVPDVRRRSFERAKREYLSTADKWEIADVATCNVACGRSRRRDRSTQINRARRAGGSSCS